VQARFYFIRPTPATVCHAKYLAFRRNTGHGRRKSPGSDYNYDIALLTGGYAGTVVGEVKGNNAPDGGSPANYLRTDMASVLSAGDKFDTVLIVGNDPNFTIAEVGLAHDAAAVPEPTTLVLAVIGLLGLTMFRRRRRS